MEVTKAIDEFHFNIAVATVRSLFNSVSTYKIKDDTDKSLIIHVTKKLLILINPMVPHLAEELWDHLVNEQIIANQSWPKVDLNYIQKDKIKLPIQVNGKVRAVIEIPLNSSEKDIETIALKEKKVLNFLINKPKKVIIIPNRVINFVI